MVNDTEKAESRTDVDAVAKVLEESLREKDFFSSRSKKDLDRLGFDPDAALMLLARHKSKAKYGYELRVSSISHILELSKKETHGSPLGKLTRSPFFLIKCCWIYDHAPYFVFYGDENADLRDALILEFAMQYEANLLKTQAPFQTWAPVINPSPLLATTFWERKIIDPLYLIEKVLREGLEGLELCVDFHPFNYAKLLPEELSEEKRRQINEARIRTGIKIDIHSPIVGPYCPSPDPSKGAQRFFNPTECMDVQIETIELAKEIGAGSVVYHLIDASNPKAMARLIESAGGSHVHATIENYCQIGCVQRAEQFVAALEDIYQLLDREVREKNFGVTLDVGHLNIEGDDPLVGAERVGKWCLDKGVFLRVHATDNYGNLLFSPPAYSADVHSNISGRGINNAVIIKLLRSLGHRIDVVAEQIQPLTPEDIATIEEAQSFPLDKTYHDYMNQGKEAISTAGTGSLIEPHIANTPAYQFLAGIGGIGALREYLVYRKIQEKKQLSVDEAKRISQEFMKMPQKVKSDLTRYIDDLLLPVQIESGAIQKSELDLICHNISGALFGTISNEHLNQIFSRERTYLKDDVICEQGSTDQEMYYLKEGEVGVYVDGTALASLGPGEIFGEMSLFYNIPKSATITVSSVRAKVGILNRSGLEMLFKGGQPYARDLIYRLFSILPQRLRNLNDKYKTAIRSLSLIFEGTEMKLPDIDRIRFELRREKADFLPTLSEKDRNILYQEIKKFRPGQKIFSEGDRADGAYFIMEGDVEVVGLAHDSEEVLLGELAEGDIFGEMSLIDDKPRSASVVARTPCKTAFISKEAFNRFIESGSDLAFRLMGFICLSLFRHILRLDSLYSDIRDRIEAS